MLATASSQHRPDNAMFAGKLAKAIVNTYFILFIHPFLSNLFIYVFIPVFLFIHFLFY